MRVCVLPVRDSNGPLEETKLDKSACKTEPKCGSFGVKVLQGGYRGGN